jgi:HK97 family phage portal protein
VRLLDRIAKQTRAERWSPQSASGAAFFTYGAPNMEKMRTSFMSYVTDGYQSNGVVFAVILARISILAEARFTWRGLTDKQLFGSTELSILENPWPNGTTGELIARMEQDASLAGNAYVRRVGDRLERCRPDWVTIVSTLDETTGLRELVGYVYQPGDGTGEIFVDIEDMAHWSPIPDPIANFRGMSWLTPVVREINADTAMVRHKGKFFENAATPNALVRYQQKLQKPVLEEVQERLNLRHAGTENAYKTLVLDSGADLTIIGNSFEQMNFTSVQAAGENRIAAAAGVPGIVPGLKEGLSAATYSNYAQAMRRFGDLTARPLWRSLCAALMPLVTPPSGAELWYDVADIAALRNAEMDQAQINLAKAQTYVELVKAGGDRVQAAMIAATGEGLDTLAPTGDIFLPSATAYFAPTQEPPAIEAGTGVESEVAAEPSPDSPGGQP